MKNKNNEEDDDEEETTVPHFDEDEKMYDSEEEAAKLREQKQQKEGEGSPKLSKKEMRKQKKQDKLRSQYDAIINHGDGDQFTLAQQTETYKGSQIAFDTSVKIVATFPKLAFITEIFLEGAHVIFMKMEFMFWQGRGVI